MPVYEYRCQKCGQEFETVQTMAEHGSARPPCPSCGSDHVEPELSSFSPQTSKKS